MSEYPVLSCRQVREIDRMAMDELKMPGLVLMENAGCGIVQLLLREGVQGPVLIACGPGNNGGDGYVIARHLDLRGVEVHVGLVFDPHRLQGDARSNFDWLAETDVHIHRLDPQGPSAKKRLPDSFDWVVDALLGTGVQGAPHAPIPEVIERLNGFSARRLAVDIPSGLDGESGTASTPTFRAELTGTFVCAKPGLVKVEASPYVGRLEIVPIGVPRRALARLGLA